MFFFIYYAIYTIDKKDMEFMDLSFLTKEENITPR